ncbi:MAG: hypothetical protein D6732_05340 [Methanobacteriota archaeon]|nr:MAG: hypothetical protein D6732_05340 [Euryarchaeota archaeon]
MAVERIIVITGSKGGGGKTPVAISVALSLEKLKIPVMLSDFNFNNADSFSILHGTNVAERKKKRWLNEMEKDDESIWRISEYLWLSKWKSVANLGLPSTVEFWEKVRKLASMDLGEKSPKVMILDTNLTLPLICLPETKVHEFQNLPTVEAWHLWSPSIVLQLGEQERFIRAITNLNRFSQGFEERMVHIFTPRHYTAISIRNTMSTLLKGEFSLTKTVKFKQSNPKPIKFNELKDALFANFLPNILNFSANNNTTIEELLVDWLKKIIEKVESREYRTNNLIIVPTVVNSIALLVEELTLKPRKTLKTIAEDLGTLFEVIQQFITSNKEDLVVYSEQPTLFQ